MKITNTIAGSVNSAGVILIQDREVISPGDGTLADVTRHYKQVLDTKEGMVRDALIRLGWTPPGSIMCSMREASTGGSGSGSQ